VNEQDPHAELRERMAKNLRDNYGYNCGGVMSVSESELLADQLIAAGFGDVAAERARADRLQREADDMDAEFDQLSEENAVLQARIDAALKADHAEYEPERIINVMRLHLLGRLPAPTEPTPEAKDTCPVCSAEMMVNGIRLNSVQLFCPNKPCEKFMALVWRDKQ
jgi:hypothetical protein